MNRSRLVKFLTVVNGLLLAANLWGGWIFFFTYGARPDGVKPASHFWLGLLWMLGPVWSLASLVTAMLADKKSRATRANGALCALYVLLWIFMAVQ
jgi:hypothetical protein